MRAVAFASAIALFPRVISGQSTEAAAKFEIADVHVSGKSPNQFMRVSPARAGRYEVKNASMVDLIRTAYGFDPDKVLGGPNWLEMRRFDVLAKVPPETTPETQKLMLQSLLQERFQLVVHKDVKPLPAYALVAGKKPQLKEADGSGTAGCKLQSNGATRIEGGIMMSSANPDGTNTTISLGPGMTLQYECRNITMESFATGLRSMMGASLGTNPVLDETGLKGKWNFDVKWSLGLVGPAALNTGDRISIFDAVDKQLGLKLEQRQTPTPVLVVDSVNEKPTGNPPGLDAALPVIPMPTEFEVAVVKPTEGDFRGMRYQMQTGGRLLAQGAPLRFLIGRALNTNNNDQIIGLPGFAEAERFDITAKAASMGPNAPAMDQDAAAPMLRALLVDRFKLKYHTEERPLPAYTLVAGKPKMKKADPASRSSCKTANAPAGSPPGSRMLTCQNVTMSQFGDQLQNMGPGLNWGVVDSTKLEGGWDFTLVFSQVGVMPAGRRGGVEGGPGGTEMAAAAEPTGSYTIFEAVERQLGLKLELQKRPLPVFVIDHIEQKPTEN